MPRKKTKKSSSKKRVKTYRTGKKVKKYTYALKQGRLQYVGRSN